MTKAKMPVDLYLMCIGAKPFAQQRVTVLPIDFAQIYARLPRCGRIS